MKRRRKIPKKVEDKLLSNSDHTCAICHKQGKAVQMHHIDKDLSNISYDNLIVLCLDHHSKTTESAGLGKKYRGRIKNV